MQALSFSLPAHFYASSRLLLFLHNLFHLLISVLFLQILDCYFLNYQLFPIINNEYVQIYTSHIIWFISNLLMDLVTRFIVEPITKHVDFYSKYNDGTWFNFFTVVIFLLNFFHLFFCWKMFMDGKLKVCPITKASCTPFTNSLVNLNYCENHSCVHMI